MLFKFLSLLLTVGLALLAVVGILFALVTANIFWLLFAIPLVMVIAMGSF